MPWKLKLGAAAAPGSARKARLATLATTIVAALCGHLENGDAAQPINDISHIAFGDEALAQRGFSLRYTGTGLALTKTANDGWALLHETLFGAAQDEGNALLSLLGGAAVAALAYAVDFHLVPPRLTPGFEKHLSKRSLLAIYCVLALALGLGGGNKGAPAQ